MHENKWFKYFNFEKTKSRIRNNFEYFEKI